MTAAIALTGNWVRVTPGRMSLARLEREASVLGKRRRISGWRIWGQPLLPEPGHLCPRVEGGMATTSNSPLMWIAVYDRLVVIRTPNGRPVTVPRLLAAALVTHVLDGLAAAREMVRCFHEALDSGARSPNRRIRGAAMMAKRQLRSGQPLTPGLMRQLWSVTRPFFGQACMAVAERTRVNPGRVRTIITSDTAWWRNRPANPPHWIEGIASVTGYPPYLVRAVTIANRWWHHGRRRRTTLRAWRTPRR